MTRFDSLAGIVIEVFSSEEWMTWGLTELIFVGWLLWETVEVNIDGSNEYTKSLKKKEDKRDYSLIRTYAEVVKNDL